MKQLKGPISDADLLMLGAQTLSLGLQCQQMYLQTQMDALHMRIAELKADRVVQRATEPRKALPAGTKTTALSVLGKNQQALYDYAKANSGKLDLKQFRKDNPDVPAHATHPANIKGTLRNLLRRRGNGIWYLRDGVEA